MRSFLASKTEKQRLESRKPRPDDIKAPEEAEWWPSLNMLLQLIKMGFSFDDLSHISWQTVMRIDRIASAWSDAERDRIEQTSGKKQQVRQATQADIDNLFA